MHCGQNWCWNVSSPDLCSRYRPPFFFVSSAAYSSAPSRRIDCRLRCGLAGACQSEAPILFEFRETQRVSGLPIGKPRQVHSVIGNRFFDWVRSNKRHWTRKKMEGDIDYKDLAMTHSSTNFDRSAYQQDVNVCFPLDHLRTLVDLQEIRSVADWHYSFMGSTAPERMEPAATEVSQLLIGDNVNLVLLIPV